MAGDERVENLSSALLIYTDMPQHKILNMILLAALRQRQATGRKVNRLTVTREQYEQTIKWLERPLNECGITVRVQD